MNALKFYYLMAFYLSKNIPKNLKYFFSFYFNLVVIVMKRPKEAPYARYYLYDAFKSIDKELFKFLKTHEQELSQEHKDLIENLFNLSQNLKRFFRFTETYEYPSLIVNLTIEGLQEYTRKKTIERRSLKPPFDVSFLAISSYLEIAKDVDKEATDFLDKL